MSRLVNFAISILVIVPCDSAGGLMKHKKATFKSRLVPKCVLGSYAGLGGNASVANSWRSAPSPIFTNWRCGVMLRSNLVRGAEMDFRHFGQCLWPAHFDQFFCSLFHTARNTAFQSQTEFLALAFQPIDESLARDDRCRRHRDVGFRSRPLLKHNVAPMPHQGLLDYARVGELVR